MPESADVTATYTFTERVNILAALETAGIEYLDVNAERVIVIYSGGVFQFETDEGDLTSTSTIVLTLYDTPPERDESVEATRSLLEQLFDRVATATDTSYDRLT